MCYVIMLQLFVLILLCYLFWKVCKIFLVTRPNQYSDTGVPTENYDESCMEDRDKKQRKEMYLQGNTYKFLLVSEIYTANRNIPNFGFLFVHVMYCRTRDCGRKHSRSIQTLTIDCESVTVQRRIYGGWGWGGGGLGG